MKLNPSVMEFFGTGQETRDWLYIDDAVDLILKTAQVKSSTVEIFNGAAGKRYSIFETLSTFLEIAGSKAKLRFNGDIRSGDPKFYWADISGALSLGWNPSITLKQGIHKYHNWLLQENGA